MTNSLKGKNVIITGASRGLGKEIAKQYSAQHCNISICARDSQELERTKQELEKLGDGTISIMATAVDVSKPDEVDILVERTVHEYGQIHVLVNNAAIIGPIGYAEETDWAHWAQTINVNLLGTMLMCRAVLKHFKIQGAGKIINLSGGGATGPMARFTAYAASKAALVRLTETLAEEVRDFGINVNAIAPGAVNTSMFDEMLLAGEERLGQNLYQRLLKQAQDGGADIRRAAELAVFLASEESKFITGKLISAVWDPWESLITHQDDLASTDIYTIRRILPKDRSCCW